MPPTHSDATASSCPFRLPTTASRSSRADHCLDPDYPRARRAGKGRDGGIDVLSDFELPPARAWQCKNHKTIDWDYGRDSLRTAMDDEHSPPHPTFVFPWTAHWPAARFLA